MPKHLRNDISTRIYNTADQYSTILLFHHYWPIYTKCKHRLISIQSKKTQQSSTSFHWVRKHAYGLNAILVGRAVDGHLFQRLLRKQAEGDFSLQQEINFYLEILNEMTIPYLDGPYVKNVSLFQVRAP